MPELPEVECIRRGLRWRLFGDAIVDVHVHRADVIHTENATDLTHRLLAGRAVITLDRHGKQLAMIGDCGRVVCVRLGMSGQLMLRGTPCEGDHVHVEWLLRSGRRLVFRDPRRFGGLWLFDSREALQRFAWDSLGPDALTITARSLTAVFARTRQCVKAALLDQGLLAGVGNIYADESLFRAGIHPLRPACELEASDRASLAASIRQTLRAAIAAGGSTLRDYVNADGQPGASQHGHAVYGRVGMPCPRCDQTIETIKIAGRTTAFCPGCQPRIDRGCSHIIHTRSVSPSRRPSLSTSQSSERLGSFLE